MDDSHGEFTLRELEAICYNKEVTITIKGILNLHFTFTLTDLLSDYVMHFFIS